MNIKEYEKLVKSKSYKENKILNIFIAFLCGGSLALLSQITSSLLTYFFKLPSKDSLLITTLIVIILSSFFTGLGFFDKIVSFSKAGLIIPTSGFAHAMTSSSMDYKQEGFIKGIGSCMFKLTGSIILYGIFFAFIFSLLKGIIS
ncbi:MAG: SpoVA/SpoVAEb family sporulation membrane protein [Bacilli bacterium]